jgi:hypothetical protein
MLGNNQSSENVTQHNLATGFPSTTAPTGAGGDGEDPHDDKPIKIPKWYEHFFFTKQICCMLLYPYHTFLQFNKLNRV